MKAAIRRNQRKEAASAQKSKYCFKYIVVIIVCVMCCKTSMCLYSLC